MEASKVDGGNAIEDANAQLRSLNRVSHRLAMVDSAEKLQMVLDKLLPRLLQRIGDNHQDQRKTQDPNHRAVLSKIHNKLVEMLSHIMKRVKDDKDCRLSNPSGILDLLLDDQDVKDCDPFSLHLSLAFLMLAIPRCTLSELEGILPGLLILHACYERRLRGGLPTTKNQWHQASHLLLRTLERIILLSEESSSLSKRTGGAEATHQNQSNKRIKTDNPPKPGEKETRNIPLGLEKARRILSREEDPRSVADATYGLFLDVFLYQTQTGTVPPNGMSSEGWERLKSGHSLMEKDWAAEMAPPRNLATFKNRLLEWIAPNRRFALFLGNTMQSSEEINPHELSSLGRSRTVALLATVSGDPMKGVSDPAHQYLKQYYDAQRDDGGFGNPTAVTIEALALCVGGINAQSILSKLSAAPKCLSQMDGGLSFRRRQVSESHFKELAITATKALADVKDCENLDVVGKLAVLASDKMLSKLGNALGLSLLRGKPYIAAAELLNGMILRMEKHHRNDLTSSQTSRYQLHARVLTLCVGVLSPIAASKTSSSASTHASEASIVVRDSIYGTVSILCRSRFAEDCFLCLLAAGNTEATSLSTELLQLLFRCAGNEIDKLRPRATAALDALLFSCRRLVEQHNKHKEEEKRRLTSNANPWATNANIPAFAETTSSTAIVNQLGKSLLPILWAAGHKSQPRQSRVAASRWSSDLLVDLDLVHATHILSFLAGDSDATTSAIAKEGLGLNEGSSTKNSNLHSIADFDTLVKIIIPEDGELASSVQPTFWDFSPSGKAIAVKCLLRSYLDDFNGGDGRGLRTFVVVLTKCLGWKDGGNDDSLDACSEALSVCMGSQLARTMIVQSSSLPLDLEGLRDLIISTTSATAKRFLADAYGSLLMDASLIGSCWVDIVTETLSLSSTHLDVEQFKPSSDIQGAALLGGTCIRVVRLQSNLVPSETYTIASSVLGRLGTAVTNADDMIGKVFCDAIYLSCLGGFSSSLDSSLSMGLASVLKNLAVGLNMFGHGDRVNAPRVLKLIEPTGVALSSDLPERKDCVDALFRLLGSEAFRKDEEIGLAIGEALSLFAESYGCLTGDVDIGNWPIDLDATFARGLSPPSQVIYTLLRTAKSTSNNHKRRGCASALLAVVARATRLQDDAALRICLQQILHEVQDCFLFLLIDPKSDQLSRESCCLGLAACDRLVIESESHELKTRLLRSFGTTTNHGGSAMQETAEQAAQRRRADGADSIRESETATPGVEVGGAGGVSEAALGAYREMASAAVASGRPDILYSMLILSVSHPIWFATEKRRDAYGPSTLQGDNFNSEEVKNALRPFLSKLLPRILRASHDPNKRTREQMETLWVGLTGGGEEGRKAITEHLRPTMDALVEDTSSKFWRARVGACGALSQICVGRSWKDLGGGPAILDENYDLVISRTSSESTLAGIRILRLWRAVIRALDDVRITVRESGEALGRSVRSLTIYLCNPQVESSDGSVQIDEGREKDAISASATVLRWLLHDGLKQQCAEAAGICISALIGIIDIAKPSILEALLSDIIYALLMAMSNLEPAAFSYLAVRGERGTDEYENLARLRIQASQSSPLATALRKCIDLVPKARSLKYQEAVVPALESAIRKSSGMATRTAAAESVITLCTTCPHMFQSSNSSGSLLRCFFDSVYRERGGKAAQDKMNSAFGALSGLCPGTAIRPLASLATERYKEAHGNNDDPAMRHASAMVLRSIAVKASQQFSDPGNTDVWCRKVLPISFLGMKDPDKAAASLWREVWEDGGAAVDVGSSNNDTGNTLEERLLLGLTKECVKALEDRSWSRRVTGAVALGNLAEKEILAPIPRRLNGEYSPSEQARAQRRANASRIALFSLVQLVGRNRIWTGKHEVVHAMVGLCKVWMPIAVHDGGNAMIENSNFLPIMLGKPSSGNDLFLGDGFFSKQTKESDDAIEESDNDDGIPISENHPSDEIQPLVAGGICRMLLMQSFPSKRALRSVSDEQVLPYRSNVLQSLEKMMKCLPDTDQSTNFRREIFSSLSPKLLTVFQRTEEKEASSTESPLIVARSIDCFAAACWRGMELKQTEHVSAMDISVLSQTFLFHSDYSKQSAWTVRQAAAKGASKLAQCADLETLQRRQSVSTLVDIAGVALKDRRFWKVRLGGLEVLQSLVLRVGDVSRASTTEDRGVQEKQIMLETILPFKENIEDLAKRSLNDSEAKVTALSTKILGILSTWP